MTIRKAVRRGKPTLVIDIGYTKKDGTSARYRKDAQSQSMTDARVEERRLLALIAQFGEPYEPREEAEDEKPPSITFAEAVILFRKGKAKTALKFTTRHGYDEILETRLLPRFGGVPIDELTGTEVEALDGVMVDEGCSSSRRRNVMIVIRSVLRAAYKAKKLRFLPEFPPLPKVGEKVLRCLTSKQVEDILDEAHPQLRLACAISAFAGLRAGEVRALRWQDVDLEANVLYVRFSRSGGVTGTPKSGHEREIPLAPRLAAMLREAKDASHGGQFVSVTSLLAPWGMSSLGASFLRVCDRLSIKGFSFHALRHYFVTTLFRTGASAPTVQRLAGHGDLSVTARYAHVGQDDLRAAVARLV